VLLNRESVSLPRMEIAANVKKLTPYDTGERLEPRLWVSRTAGLTDNNRDMFGKVDFENDESATEITIYVERKDGQRIIHIEDHTGELSVIRYNSTEL